MLFGNSVKGIYPSNFDVRYMAQETESYNWVLKLNLHMINLEKIKQEKCQTPSPPPSFLRKPAPAPVQTMPTSPPEPSCGSEVSKETAINYTKAPFTF